MKFTKNDPGFVLTAYSGYREYTRNDFRRICAYCFRHEDECGGAEHYEQDHFEPKSRPNVDPSNYWNLYWSCRGCNSRSNKGEKWPRDSELAQGRFFCDPCRAEPMGVDYELSPDGCLVAKTSSGDYTITHIRLNRQTLRDWREAVIQDQLELTEQIARLERINIRLQDEEVRNRNPDASRVRHIIEGLIREHRQCLHTECFVHAHYHRRPRVPDDIMRLLFSSQS